MGGFGSAVAEAFMDNNILVPMKRFGVPDQLVDHAQPEEAKAEVGLTSSQIAEQVLSTFFEEEKTPSAVAK
jgi:1-deoxy-D-xylulose-5-phosphate synthase